VTCWPTVLEQRSEPQARPPPKTNAVPSLNAAQDPTARDCDIAEIQIHGRMAWQKASGYNQRSRIEAKMGRWKAVIGPKLKTRTRSGA
jgi:hypothetical protein